MSMNLVFCLHPSDRLLIAAPACMHADYDVESVNLRHRRLHSPVAYRNIDAFITARWRLLEQLRFSRRVPHLHHLL